MNKMDKSGLILSNNCEVYHLNFNADMLAPIVFTVGDPERISMFKPYFSTIHKETQSREIRALKGLINGKEVLVISTGMGTDNIDIVVNELELLANWDLNRQEMKKELQRLKIIRLGTSGALSPNFQVDDIVFSRYAFAFDNQHIWYPLVEDDAKENKSFNNLASSLTGMGTGIVSASESLMEQCPSEILPSLNYTANGFYANQGRFLKDSETDLFDKISSLSFAGMDLGNIEMETAGLYRLAAYYGHEAISVSALLAQRKKGGFSKNPTETLNTALSMLIESFV